MKSLASPARKAVVVLSPLVAIAGVAAAHGGYFATSFGWTTLAFAWFAVVVVMLGAPRWGIFDRLWVVAGAGLCLYTFVSAEWAGSIDAAIQGAERTLVYVTGVAAALLILRRGDFSRWLGGLVLGAGCICVYSLATRLYPTHFGGFNTSDYRLFLPIGYWNALGIFAGIALLLGFGVAALGRVAWLRVTSAAAMVVLAPTIYFTFSRGALIAIAVGVVALFALSPYRLRLVSAAAAIGMAPATGVLLAWRSHGLTHRSSTLAAASHDGRRLALELAILVLVEAIVTVAFIFVSARLQVPRVVRRAFGVAVLVVVIGALAAVVVKYGSPPKIARHAYHSFVSTPTIPANLNNRFLSLSNNGRTVLWHSAWKEFAAHPVAGSGEGGFARWWLAHRTSPYFVLDTHDLYLQTLGELGAIGFALLTLFLGLPLVAAVRARRNPLVAPAFGGYVAYLAHAAVDWDWQMPAVSLLALFAAASIVAASRRRDPGPPPLPQPARIAIATASIVAATFAFVALIGNIALAGADLALVKGSGRTAAVDGAKAHRWVPWSTRALRDLGQGRVLIGQRRAGLAALRDAATKDPGDWQTWFDIAAATSGAEHRAALARARALNPQSPEIIFFLQYTAAPKKAK